MRIAIDKLWNTGITMCCLSTLQTLLVNFTNVVELIYWRPRNISPRENPISGLKKVIETLEKKLLTVKQLHP